MRVPILRDVTFVGTPRPFVLNMIVLPRFDPVNARLPDSPTDPLGELPVLGTAVVFELVISPAVVVSPVPTVRVLVPVILTAPLWMVRPATVSAPTSTLV